MEEKDLIKVMEENLVEAINNLQKRIDDKFERMKQIIIDYLNLGSDFAKGSLITALKQV